MSTIVIMPGGFHPFHAGHMSLYNSARKAFPDAELFVAATDSREERPFPFTIKEKLAKVAGVEPGHFIQVKSPFQAKEITQNYNPEQDVLIFVRSEKDRNESPKPGGMKKDGTPAYFQPYDAENLQPFGKHAYFAYLPTVKFGPGITSATEIRKAWPTLDDRRKTAMVMSLYPATQKNLKLAQVVVKLLDAGMGGQQGVAEGSSLGYTVIVRGNDFSYSRLKDALSDGHPSPAKVYKNGKFLGTIGSLSNQGVAEGQDMPDANGNYKFHMIAFLRNGDIKEFNVIANGDRNAKILAKKKLIEKGYTKIYSIHIQGMSPVRGPVNYEIDRKLRLEQKGVAEGSDSSGWIGDPTKWKEAVLNTHGTDVKFRNYNHPGQPDKRSVHAMGANDKIVGVYQRHNKMGMVQPNMQGVAEGEVIPFARKPQPKLTWQQVPKDVLLLANDWFWADEDDMGLDAVLDPKGYGSGTSNDLKYITAKLQQKGWTIEHDLDDNRPGQFNMKLTNKLGQSVLLPWADAQDFKGWAAGTRPSMEEGDENQYRRPSTGEIAKVSQQTRAKLNPVRSQFVWKKPNQIGGSFSEQDLLAQGFKKSQYNSWGGTQQMWDRLSGVKEARVLFTNPNTKVNVYYNSRNPKYFGKPVQVAKEIPYNKIDKFIDMVVAKYQIKPTELIWRDAIKDSTDAHIMHETSDYLEEK